MTATLVALPARSGGTLHEKLVDLVRPEFRADVIRVAPDDPVFGRGTCGVDACRRSAWTRQLCHAHYLRWRRDGKPDPQVFAATTGPITDTARAASIGVFDLRGLRPQARLEIAYVIQCRQADRAQRLLGSTIRHLVGLLADANADSLLDEPLATWLDRISARAWADPSRTVGLVRYAWRRLTDVAQAADADSEFARDTWRADVLGVHTPIKGTRLLHFEPIAQPWLRAAVKRFARFRLATGKAFSSVDIDVRSVRWLSRFLAEHHPEVAGPGSLGREVIEHYLSWFLAVGMAGHTTNTLLVCVRGFLDACRRFGWLPGLPADAAIYLDELPRRPQPLPRFVSEFVMAQIDDSANLARLPDDTTRHLLVVIIETGLRANDACTLPFNPIVSDSVGWPCLKFFNHKMAAEQLVPLSSRAADAIRAQQAHVRGRWPDGPAVLFPSPQCNPDGVRPFSYATFRERLARWERHIGLHDEAGQPVKVTAHQFRHTLGTRLINAGVPHHVVQKMPGHASPQMTARYATIHDATVRAAFDDYQRRRVDIHGQRLGFDPDAPAADAEWVKHNLARVAASLPNGYCGRPPQQDCPHPNACLTCPDFQTTPQFRPLHRRQRDDTLMLVTAAEQAGKTRLADNHRQVAGNLERVIAALEAIDEEPTDAH